VLALTGPQAALVAAGVAAAVALIGHILSWRYTAKALQQQEEAHQAQVELDMWTEALSYFDGKSQRRTVGIAMLKVLMSRPSSSDRVRYATQAYQVFHTQAQYLLLHGSNRHQSHEIENLTLLIETLLYDDGFDWMIASADRPKVLSEALASYKENAEEEKDRDGASKMAIDQFVKRTSKWELKLKNASSSSTRS